MIGQTLGKYRVQDRIGRGGMGTVYLALDETLRREVAIKVLNSELNDPEIARRFRAEAVTVARLNHPGIATVYELFEYDSQWLMVMEFVRGETFEHMVERLGPLPIERAAELCMQALHALAHAHSMGVVHRDLKPANLMVTESGLVKVMDFGIARVAGSEHLTTAGFMMGTPAYMSPEQVLGHEIDARADLYAMGVVLYRLTTGKLPFKGDSPFAMAQSQVNDPPTPVGLMRAGLPPWVEQVIGRALSKAPEDRFQTADEFRETIRRGLAGLPIEVAANAFVPPELLLTAPPGTLRTITPRTATPTAAPSTAAAPAVASATPASPLPSGQPVTAPVPISASTPVVPPPTVDPDLTIMATNLPPLGPGTGAVGQPSGAMSRAGASTGQTAVPITTAQMAAAPTGQTAATPAAAPGTTAVISTAAGATAQMAAAPAKKSSLPLLAVAAGVVVVGAVAFFLWYRSHAAAPAGTDATANTTASAEMPPPAPPAATQPETPPPPVTAAPATPPPTTTPDVNPATAAGTTPAPVAPGGARGDAAGNPATSAPAGTGTGTGTAARGRGTAVAPAPDPYIAYSDGKILILNGKKAQEQDVIISFVAGLISVAPKKGGAAIWTISYKDVAHATYIHAKDPKWDATLPSPPDGLDIPGFMRGARHWLVIQARIPDPGYVILRLDDSNWNELLGTFETRTTVKVDRLSPGGE